MMASVAEARSDTRVFNGKLYRKLDDVELLMIQEVLRDAKVQSPTVFASHLMQVDGAFWILDNGRN